MISWYTVNGEQTIDENNAKLEQFVFFLTPMNGLEKKNQNKKANSN